MENGGRAVERKAQHLSIGRGVIASHSRHVGIGVKGDPSFFHDLAHGHDGTLAGHHGGGAHFEHLQDVRRIAGTEGGDGGGHGLVVAALEGGHDLVIFLAVVEVFGQVVDPLTEGAAHGVPPLDFGLGLGGQAGQTQSQGGQCEFEFHGGSCKSGNEREN